MKSLLKRYWFVINTDSRYGPGNVGVTAYSQEEARSLLLESFTKMHFSELLEQMKTNNNIEIIEDIDMQLLDKDHVMPNIGPVVFKGVWFPRLNMNENI